MDDSGSLRPPRLPSFRVASHWEEPESLRNDATAGNESFVSYAIKTGRQLNTGKDLSRYISLSKTCVDIYVLCAKIVHADQIRRKFSIDESAQTGDQRPMGPAALNLIAWAQKAKEEVLPKYVEEQIKPKVVDILMFFITAHAYPDEEIAAFVDGISDFLVSPPLSAIKHDWASGKVFKNLVNKFGTEAIRLDKSTGKERVVGMSLWKAVTANLVPAPCVSIQRCHALYPLQVSSPMNPLTPDGRKPRNARDEERYSDLTYFSDNSTRPYFSAVFPLLLSLVRLDELQHELESMWKLEEGLAGTTDENAVCFSLKRWNCLNRMAEHCERVWRKTAILVDFVDPEVRKISEINRKHRDPSSGNLGNISIETAGLRAVKRQRSPTREPSGGNLFANRYPPSESAGAFHKNTSWRSLANSDNDCCVQDTPHSSDFTVLPRDIFRHIATFLTPRYLTAFAFTSKTVAKRLLPLVSSPEGHSLEDLFILRSLQLSRNASRLLRQCAEQLWSERFTYMNDVSILTGSNPNANGGDAIDKKAALFECARLFTEMREHPFYCSEKYK